MPCFAGRIIHCLYLRAELSFIVTLLYLNQEKAQTKRRPSPDKTQANAVFSVYLICFQVVFYLNLNKHRY
jgi:hypothetical protein